MTAGAAPLLLPGASCVALAGPAGAAVGVLIRGAPGAGKSSLALRLIARGARLIADDLVALSLDAGRVTAHSAPEAPTALTGVIEARGLGLMRLVPLDRAPLGWIVDLAPGAARTARADRPAPPPAVHLLEQPIPRLVGEDSSLLADQIALLARGAELLSGDALEELGPGVGES